MVKRRWLPLRVDKWNSNFFKERIARVKISDKERTDSFSESLSELLSRAQKKKVGFLVIKLQGSNPKLVRSLIKAGFKKYGESADLVFRYKEPGKMFTKEIYCSDYRIGLCKPAHIKGVRDIARDAFRLSYLYKCGFGKKSKVDSYHSVWAENLIKDKDVEVFVAEKNGRVLGFATLRINMRRREGRIDLIAVDKRFRGKGIGNQLVKKCIGSGRGRLKEIFIKTQKENKALSLYKKRGFAVYSYDKIFCKRLI